MRRNFSLQGEKLVVAFESTRYMDMNHALVILADDLPISSCRTEFRVQDELYFG